MGAKGFGFHANTIATCLPLGNEWLSRIRTLTAPTLKAKPFNDPNRVWELKHDGYGALLINDGERTASRLERAMTF